VPRKSLLLGSLFVMITGCGGQGTTDDVRGAGGSPSSAGGVTGTGGGGAPSTNGSGGAVTASGGTPSATGTGGAVLASGGAPSMATPTTITLSLDSFSVPPGGEYYKCQDFPNTFGGNIAIIKSESKMTVGSHHLFVFRLSSGGFYGGTPNLGAGNTKGPLVDCPSGGTEFHPFVHAAQTPDQVVTYPAGIGQAFNSDETVRVMVHLLNTTTNPITASTSVDLVYVGADQVQQLAASVFLNALSVRVPPGMSTQGFSYQLPMDANLLGASGHMHQRGVHFIATAALPDGSKKDLYQTDTWSEPVPAAFDPALPLTSGTTIKWACSYANSTGKTFRFGESAATNEMCIFTGSYYPAPGGGGIYDQDLDTATAN